MPANTRYVGRGSKDGNEFRVGDDLSYYLGPDARKATAAQCVFLHAETLAERMAADPQAGNLMVKRLRGQNLACWCALCQVHRDGKPFDVECQDCAPCHVDTLGRLANAPISNAGSHKQKDRAHVQG